MVHFHRLVLEYFHYNSPIRTILTSMLHKSSIHPTNFRCVHFYFSVIILHNGSINYFFLFEILLENVAFCWCADYTFMSNKEVSRHGKRIVDSACGG